MTEPRDTDRAVPDEGLDEAGAFGSNSGTAVGDAGNVEVDGIISDFFKYNGRYRPRDHEVQAWGPSVGALEGQDDVEELLYMLIKNTNCTRWREGLRYMIKESTSEHPTRQIFAFLHANALNGIKTLTESGFGASVQIDTSVPKCIKCPDWMAIMEGLNFDLTSPGTVRDVNYIDVTIGKHSDEKALSGFCYLMKALLNMSWTNIRLMSIIDTNEGAYMYNLLQMLRAGCGMDSESRVAVKELMSKYPHLMKCLGFVKNGGSIQWQNLGENMEYVSLLHTFNGLFRSADTIESVL